ncbi:MAG: hypothetical protein KBD78_10285 [Oligoflexales bacterium]|nr:hypothetical protein [Oligoflexales bacterium]
MKLSYKTLHENIRSFVRFIQNYVGRIWYPPFVGFLAALDNFIVVVPTDGILISSSMLIPKKWFFLALSIAIGSTMGAVGLAALVEIKGLPFILDLYPGIQESNTWIWSTKFFEKYGLLLVFVVAVTPFVQQPAVILACLAQTPLAELGAVIFCGRLIKYLIMAFVGSHAPGLLSKLWGLKTELKDVGVKIE